MNAPSNKPFPRWRLALERYRPMTTSKAHAITERAQIERRWREQGVPLTIKPRRWVKI